MEEMEGGEANSMAMVRIVNTVKEPQMDGKGVAKERNSAG